MTAAIFVFRQRFFGARVWTASAMRSSPSLPGQLAIARMVFDPRNTLQLGQRYSALVLVLALALCIGRFGHFIALEKQKLGQPFLRVDLGRQWRRVRDLERQVAAPFR